MKFLLMFWTILLCSPTSYSQSKIESPIKETETSLDIAKKEEFLKKQKDELIKKQEEQSDKINKEIKIAESLKNTISTTKQGTLQNIKDRQDLTDLQTEINFSQRIKKSAATMIEALNTELNLLTKQLSQLREQPFQPLPFAKKTISTIYNEAIDTLAKAASQAYEELIKIPQPGQPDRWKEIYQKIADAIKKEIQRFQNNQLLDWKKRKEQREKALHAQLGTADYNAEYNNTLNQLELSKSNIIKLLLNFIDNETQTILKKLDEDENKFINTGLFTVLVEDQKKLTDLQQSIKQNSPFVQATKKMTGDTMYRQLTGNDNPYTLLGIDVTATPNEIEKAYAMQLSKNRNPQEMKQALESVSGDVRGQTDTLLDFLQDLSSQMTKKIQTQEKLFLGKISNGIEKIKNRSASPQKENKPQG
ncbi:MAG: hypothetical protein BWY54_00459 [Candidatus Dependentiae bacterium ADurb.Bin331]|nr:MAG: hypothetical protein BWY54_00459 [Candidatus Dependentiae bacterium ADurb.Bin331]